MARVLVTGGTGFLGSYVLPLLRKRHEVQVVSRSASRAIVMDIAELPTRFESFEGFDLVLHMAGLYDFRAQARELFRTNVFGTRNVLGICKRCSIPRMINISSVAATANLGIGQVSPYDLRSGGRFPDLYSQTKALAEEQFRSWQGPLPEVRVNLRLGPVVGDTKEGLIKRVDGPYVVAEKIRQARKALRLSPPVVPLPGSQKQRLPLIPVDVAAAAVCGFVDATLSMPAGYRSFHLVPKRGLGHEDFYRDAFSYFAIGKRPLLVERFLTKALGRAFRFPEAHYMTELGRPDEADTREVLGESWCPEYESYKTSFWKGYSEFLSNSRN